VTVHYERHPELRLTALEGEGVALHLGARRYFTVSETGLTILEALRSPQTPEALVDHLLAQYDVTPEHARASVDAFLARCHESALIRVVDA
jgi:hypothetical protein